MDQQLSLHRYPEHAVAFPHFSEIPEEIRRQIWVEAIGPRTICVKIHWVKFGFPSPSSDTILILLHTNQESRHEITLHYLHLNNVFPRFTHSERTGRIGISNQNPYSSLYMSTLHFNPGLDTLCLNGSHHVSIFELWNMDDTFNSVRKLKLRLKEDFFIDSHLNGSSDQVAWNRMIFKSFPNLEMLTIIPIIGDLERPRLRNHEIVPLDSWKLAVKNFYYRHARNIPGHRIPKILIIEPEPTEYIFAERMARMQLSNDDNDDDDD